MRVMLEKNKIPKNESSSSVIKGSILTEDQDRIIAEVSEKEADRLCEMYGARKQVNEA